MAPRDQRVSCVRDPRSVSPLAGDIRSICALSFASVAAAKISVVSWSSASPTNTLPSSVAKLPVSPEDSAATCLHAGELAQALTILMSRYGDEVYRHCRQVLGDSDLAADVHQTVFVQAYRDLPSFTGRASFRTWLYAIARHRCLDALKIQKRRRLRFLLGAVAQDRPDPRPDAREQLQGRAEADAMTRALETLKPEVRIAVLLRYREEMSFEEMADVCGEQAATLQARVARALPKLKKSLQRQGGRR